MGELGGSDRDAEIDTDFKRLFLSQPAVDPELNCFIANIDDEPSGMARVSPEPEIDRVVAEIAVLPRHRQRGVGRQLLDRVLERAAEVDASFLHIQVPVHSRGGRFLLEDSGFYATRRYWRLNASVGQIEKQSLPQGYSITHFELDRDEQMLTDLQNASFHGSWGFCPNTVDQIAAKVRLRPRETEDILLLRDGDEVCGYNWTQRTGEHGSITGIIGMTGVHPDYRGKGLGRVVVTAGIIHLSQKGASSVKLEVDHSNKPARELYLSLGFELAEETVWYELNINS